MDIQPLAIAVGASAGLVELAKRVGLPDRFAPLGSLVFGILMVALFTGGFSIGALSIGVITGLTASGLYSGVKATVAKKKDA